MENTKFLPLGSIVILKGGVKKSVVIARAVAVRVGEEDKYFEYGGCLYPEGLLGDAILYFNNDDIQKIVQEGYRDEDDIIMTGNLNDTIKQMGIEKTTPSEFNQKKGAAGL